MFYKDEDNSGYVELVEGIQIKTVCYGEKTLTAKFKLAKGSTLPRHKHPHEQTGYLISGNMEFEISGEKMIAAPGDSWNIEGNCEHGAQVLEDSVVLEVFCPVRVDYLPQNLDKKLKAR